MAALNAPAKVMPAILDGSHGATLAISCSSHGRGPVAPDEQSYSTPTALSRFSYVLG